MPSRRRDPAATYDRFRRAIADEPTPLAFVDIGAFDRNADLLLRPVQKAGKTLRVASKSIRCVDLMRRFIDRSAGTARGVMTYSAREVAFLAGHGFDDLLLAYPVATRIDAARIAKTVSSGATVAVAIDSIEHIDLLDAAAAEHNVRIRVVIDVDLSLRPVGENLHLGVRRSPLHRADDVIRVAELAARRAHLEVVGVLAYEAHIAGVTDANPFTTTTNAAKGLLRRVSKRPVFEERAAIVRAFERASLPLTLFNGGGTGSIEWSSSDPSLTEVTAGSGLLASHLFDYFKESQIEPAAFFALTVTRLPAPGFATCHSGGFVASGEIGVDRLPVPTLPAGLALTQLEGAGEVQTPLLVPEGVSLRVGDPVFFRHAKAGELSEHFNEYLLIDQDTIVGRAQTYRGMGQRF
ncbi:MAG: alanine racemase [Polyangiaceae bacterium]